jgi:hypothetical protein
MNADANSGQSSVAVGGPALGFCWPGRLKPGLFKWA